jgi:hypothetical protein
MFVFSFKYLADSRRREMRRKNGSEVEKRIGKES